MDKDTKYFIICLVAVAVSLFMGILVTSMNYDRLITYYGEGDTPLMEVRGKYYQIKIIPVIYQYPDGNYYDTPPEGCPFTVTGGLKNGTIRIIQKQGDE